MCLAVPGKVLEVHGDKPLSRTAKVSFGGIIKNVSLVYEPEVEVGDYVIVHVGFAISRLNEKDAEEVFTYLQEMGEITAALGEAEGENNPFVKTDKNEIAGEL